MLRVLGLVLLLTAACGNISRRSDGDGGPGDSGVDTPIDAPPPTARLTIDKTSADLGSVIVGQTSPPATFTITNTGTATSSTPTVTVTGTFYTLVAGGCSATLAPNASCNVQVTVTPLADGTPTGSLTVTATQGGTVTASLTSTALLPGELTIAPTSHNFNTVVTGFTSATQDFTVTNTGGATTGVVLAALGGSDADHFEITADTCTSTLAGGGSCIVTVRFTPATGATGLLQATLTASASPGGNVVANLSGTAEAPGNIVVGGTGAFGNLQTGLTSVNTLTVTNSGGQATTALSITKTGDNQFSILTGMSGDCVDGVTLAGGASCNIRVQFAPTAPGAVTGSVMVSATVGGSGSVALSGTGLAPGQLTIAPTSHNFGVVVAGQLSGTQNFTVTNTGGIATGTLSVALGGSAPTQYEITANTCSGALAGGAMCTITVRFRPSASSSGSQLATLTASASPGGSPSSMLSGTAQVPAAIGLTGSGAFGNVQTGLTATNLITVTNNGQQTTSAVTITRTGDNQFSILTGGTGDCVTGVTTLVGGASCNIRVQFAPTAAGAVTGSIMVSAATGGSGSVTLSGTGLAPAQLTIAPTSHNFGVVVAGQLSGTQNFTVTNTGGIATGTLSVALGGSAPTQYEITANTCSGALAGGAMCTITVRFRPSGASSGSQPATLTASASPGGSASSMLSGTAQVPASIALGGSGAFGDQDIGTTSVKTLTVTNNGQQATSALTISRSGSSQFSILGGGVGDCVTGTTTLAGSASCNIRVQYAPTVAGAATGTIMVSATTGGSQSTALSGNGVVVPVFDYYVDVTNGNDGNPGTSALPFKTISRAMVVVTAGKSVKVRPGTYSAASGETFPITVPASVLVEGHVANVGVGTLVTGSGTVPGEATLKAIMIVGNADVITGLSFNGSTANFTFGLWTANVTATITYNTFAAGYGGVRLTGTGTSTVGRNSFDTSSYGVYGVGISQTPIVEFNNFSAAALPLDVSGGTPILRNNTVVGNGQVGLQIQSGNPSVSNNTFTNAAGYTYGCIRAGGGTGIIRGNTCDIGAKQGILIDGGANPNFGTAADPGGNAFTGASGLAISHQNGNIITAIGNTWYNNPPICGQDIVVTGTGQVTWGAQATNKCP